MRVCLEWQANRFGSTRLITQSSGASLFSVFYIRIRGLVVFGTTGLDRVLQQPENKS